MAGSPAGRGHGHQGGRGAKGGDGLGEPRAPGPGKQQVLLLVATVLPLFLASVHWSTMSPMLGSGSVLALCHPEDGGEWEAPLE